MTCSIKKKCIFSHKIEAVSKYYELISEIWKKWRVRLRSRYKILDWINTVFFFRFAYSFSLFLKKYSGHSICITRILQWTARTECWKFLNYIVFLFLVIFTANIFIDRGISDIHKPIKTTNSVLHQGPQIREKFKAM